MIFWLFLCICFIIFVLIKLISPRPLPTVPKISGWPIVGNYFQFANGKPYEYLMRNCQEHDPIVQIQLGTQWVVVLNDYDIIKEAFSNPKLASRPDWISMKVQSESPYHFAFRTFGPEWRFLRKTSVKALTMLKVSKENKAEEQCLLAVKTLCKFFKDSNGESVNPSWAIFQCISTVMGVLSFGSEFDPKDKKLGEILGSAQNTSRLTRIGSMVDCFPWLSFVHNKSINGMRMDNSVFDSYVISKLKLHKMNSSVVDLADALSTLSTKYPQESDLALCSKYVAVDLFGAGVFTTLTNLEWALLILAKHENIQGKMRFEINTHVGQVDLVTISHRSALPYCEAVLHEVLRFCTVLPFGVPHGSVETTVLRGHKLRSNTAILPNLWAVHHDPHIFCNPYEFYPNRFLNDDNTINTFMTSKVISFSTGLRRCPGEYLARQNLFIILTNVIKSFKLNLASSYEDLEQCEVNFSRKPLPYRLNFVKLKSNDN